MKAYKYFCSFFLIFILLATTGCNIFEKVVEDKNLIIYSNRDSTDYVYSNKIALIDNNNSTDTLVLRNDGEITNKTDWIEFGAVMINGQFEKSAYYDGILFILNEDANYYSININDFDVENFEYNILTYTQKELETEYPNYESFEWYSH